MRKEDLIDEFIASCGYIIPLDDSNYEEKLLRMAEQYADSVLNPDPELVRMCEDHDKIFNLEQ